MGLLAAVLVLAAGVAAVTQPHVHLFGTNGWCPCGIDANAVIAAAQAVVDTPYEDWLVAARKRNDLRAALTPKVPV